MSCKRNHRQNGNLRGFITLLLLAVQGAFLYASTPEKETYYYKMLSGVQYEGAQQFKSQTETQFCVNKTVLAGNQVDYVISAIESVSSGLQEQSIAFPVKGADLEDVYMTIDRTTHKIIRSEPSQSLLAQACNFSIASIQHTEPDRIGREWTESVDLSRIDASFSEPVKLTLNAISLPVENAGEMIAIRAMSDPVIITIASREGMPEQIQARIRAVYLFDPALENVYLSICVYEATAKIDGKTEKVRHEIATYKTDAEGTPFELKGLDDKFELFIRKVGLQSDTVDVVEPGPVPLWAKSDALRISQIMNVCTAAICEGALNPVAAISLPSSKMVAAQTLGQAGLNSGLPCVAQSLSQNLPELGTMKIAVAPAAAGLGLGKTAAIAGGSVGGVAVAGGSSSGSRSPSTP